VQSLQDERFQNRITVPAVSVNNVGNRSPSLLARYALFGWPVTRQINETFCHS